MVWFNVIHVHDAAIGSEQFLKKFRFHIISAKSVPGPSSPKLNSYFADLQLSIHKMSSFLAKCHTYFLNEMKIKKKIIEENCPDFHKHKKDNKKMYYQFIQ